MRGMVNIAGSLSVCVCVCLSVSLCVCLYECLCFIHSLNSIVCLLYGSVLWTLSSKCFHIVKVYSVDYIAVYTRILPCVAK